MFVPRRFDQFDHHAAGLDEKLDQFIAISDRGSGVRHRDEPHRQQTGRVRAKVFDQIGHVIEHVDFFRQYSGDRAGGRQRGDQFVTDARGAAAELDHHVIHVIVKFRGPDLDENRAFQQRPPFGKAPRGDADVIEFHAAS